MEVKFWSHENVSPSGKVKSGGSVNTKRGITNSNKDGCYIENCNCRKDLWVCINKGYCKKEKSVSGCTYYFQTQKEYNKFIRFIFHKKEADCINSRHLNTTPDYLLNLINEYEKK